MGLFDTDVDFSVDLTPEEVAIQKAALEGLSQFQEATLRNTEAIRNALGFRTDTITGSLVSLTQQEYLSALPPIDRQSVTNLLTAQSQLGEALQGGEPSLSLREQQAERARIRAEEGARLGSGRVVNGRFVPTSTSGIQREQARLTVEGLEREAERERKLNQLTGITTNLRGQLSDIARRRVVGLTEEPLRFLEGTGLFGRQQALSAERGLFNAQQQLIARQSMQDLLGTAGTLLLNKLIP